MFVCARCDQFADADDGCDDYGKTGLICASCLDPFPEILTSFDCPPIPVRSFDWSAVTDDYDGAEDSSIRGQIGHGETRGEAIKDLIENHLAEQSS